MMYAKAPATGSKPLPASAGGPRLPCAPAGEPVGWALSKLKEGPLGNP